MLICTHVLAGAVIGRLLQRPFVAAAAGALSHFALDSRPHWGRPSPGARMDDVTLRVAVADGLSGLGLIAAVAATTPQRHLAPVLAGIAGSCLPDLDKPAELFFGRSPFPGTLDDWHARIQQERADLLVRDVVVAAGLTALVLAGLRAAARGSG